MKWLKKWWLCLMVVLLAILLIGSMMPDEAIRYEPYTVQSGDTLWDISKEFTPADRDCRGTIEEIKKVNKLENGKIYAGQVILVPIYEEEM